MDGKGLSRSVILGTLLMLGSLAALPQAQAMLCCKDENARNCFDSCLFIGSPRSCLGECGCRATRAATCPGDYPTPSLLPSKGDRATEFCKLGCRSSVCATMISTAVDGTEEMKAVVERCGEACRRLCDGHAGAGAGAGHIASVAA